MMRALAGWMLLLFALTVGAAETHYTLRVNNPERSLGYTVGDIVTRTVTIETVAPYQLVKASLPLKGFSRHGIELRDTELKRTGLGDRTRYTIKLEYQVFASAGNGRKLTLPRETLLLAGDGRHLEVRIPAWIFTLSPIAARDDTDFAGDMSPYLGPMLREVMLPRATLIASLLLSVLALAGLAYYNGHWRWLPDAGRPLAKACRELKRLSDDDAPQAAGMLARAFKQTFGQPLFATNLDDFLRAHPRFAPLKEEIVSYLRTADALLYGRGSFERYPMLTLRHFAQRCRDCEREPLKLNPLAAVTLCSILLTAAVVLLMQRIQVLPMWPLVIAWACFFHLGGGLQPRDAIKTVLVGTVFGVLIGWLSALTLMVNPLPEFVSGPIWAVLVISAAVGFISVCAYWKIFAITPVCIYGYAATWGFLDVPGRFDWEVLTSLDWQNVVLALPVAIAMGCAFAWFNARMVGALVRSPA